MMRNGTIGIIFLLAIMVVTIFARDAHAGTDDDSNPQLLYHEDRAHLQALDAQDADVPTSGLIPYQGDALDDADADSPVKMYSTPGLGLAYKPEATPRTTLKLDMHGLATDDDPDARNDNPFRTPGNIEAGASFHF